MATSKPLIGKFITLEGGESVGKSTNIAFVQQWLQARDLNVLVTREPGGTPAAEAIRDILLRKWQEPITEQAELLMVFAARAQHISQVILPAINDGTWVISDRFTDATLAYQGYGRGMSLARIATIESWLPQDLSPDLTLLLDAPIEVSRERGPIAADSDRFERENQDFFQRVRNGYLELAQQHAARYRVINASLPLAEVQDSIDSVLSEYLEPMIVD